MLLSYIAVVSRHICLKPDMISIRSRLLQRETQKQNRLSNPPGQVWSQAENQFYISSMFLPNFFHDGSTKTHKLTCVIKDVPIRHSRLRSNKMELFFLKLTVQSTVLQIFASGSVLFRDDVLGSQGKWCRLDLAIAFLKIPIFQHKKR